MLFQPKIEKSSLSSFNIVSQLKNYVFQNTNTRFFESFGKAFFKSAQENLVFLTCIQILFEKQVFLQIEKLGLMVINQIFLFIEANSFMVSGSASVNRQSHWLFGGF